MRSSQRKHAPDIAGSDKRVQTSPRGIAEKAKTNGKHRFQNLFGMIDEEFLACTYGRLNKGSAPGGNRVTVRRLRVRLLYGRRMSCFFSSHCPIPAFVPSRIC